MKAQFLERGEVMKYFGVGQSPPNKLGGLFREERE